MLRTSKPKRYSATLQKALPTLQRPRFVVERSFKDTIKLSGKLVASCKSIGTHTLEPYQQVRKMQVISTTYLARTLAKRRGVKRLARLFDKDCDLMKGPVKDSRSARSGLQGEHPFLAETLALLDFRIAKLYPQFDHLDPCEYEYYRVSEYYWQALWRALVIECPISSEADALFSSMTEECILYLHPYRLKVLSQDQNSVPGSGALGIADWDTLAGCIVTLRECAEQGLKGSANHMASHICQLLTMMGVEFQDRGVGFHLLSYCCKHILPLGGLEVEPIALVRASALLNTLIVGSYQHKESDICWARRRFAMAHVQLNQSDPNLQTVCDPTQYVNGYPKQDAWQNLYDKLIDLGLNRYPPGEWKLNLSGLVAAYPTIEEWVIPKKRSVWNGLGSRNHATASLPI